MDLRINELTKLISQAFCGDNHYPVTIYPNLTELAQYPSNIAKNDRV
jgi:hypothetical protein